MTIKKTTKKVVRKRSVKKTSIKKATPKTLGDSILPKPPQKQLDEGLVKQIIKALQSPQLNGGMETLVHKVDSIEKSQGQTQNAIEGIQKSQAEMGKNVEKVLLAVYDPDEGLFARVKTAEGKTENYLGKLDEWKTSIEKELQRDESNDVKMKEQIELNEKALHEVKTKLAAIEISRKKAGSIIKWVSVAVGSSIVTTSLKILYDILNIAQ